MVYVREKTVVHRAFTRWLTQCAIFPSQILSYIALYGLARSKLFFGVPRVVHDPYEQILFEHMPQDIGNALADLQLLILMQGTF